MADYWFILMVMGGFETDGAGDMNGNHEADDATLKDRKVLAGVEITPVDEQPTATHTIFYEGSSGQLAFPELARIYSATDEVPL